MGYSGSAARVVEIRLTARAMPGPSVEMCRECSHELDLHQPDSADPDRLLGTCPECGAWLLVQLDSSGGPARVVELPGPAALARAFSAPPKGPTLALAKVAPRLLATTTGSG
jgi:hypothetical protein